ncbi:MAG TPA: rhodanese-like domain-containing protein [Gemmatimonadaceae bacterium]|jgi:rhodanese-related sulfurtransferase|nr:rhodanese-like domain-containing protein [Gemmatimonadaceae bacterium]
MTKWRPGIDAAGYEEAVRDSRTRIREIRPREAIPMHARSDVLFLDVREPQEWNLFHIPGAVHLPLGDVERRARDVVPSEPQRTIVAYCARGNRSAIGADMLREMGYTDVVSLADGIRGWVDAGGEVEQ